MFTGSCASNAVAAAAVAAAAFAAVAAAAAAAAAPEQHVRLRALVSKNKSSFEWRGEREAAERRLMQNEEKSSKSYHMQLEAFR